MTVIVLSKYDEYSDGYNVIGVFSSVEKLPAYTKSRSYIYETKEFELDRIYYGN